nr:hypothetical protein L204_02718 [Cryptococcus depauperatus CBS 7855]
MVVIIPSLDALSVYHGLENASVIKLNDVLIVKYGMFVTQYEYMVTEIMNKIFPDLVPTPVSFIRHSGISIIVMKKLPGVTLNEYIQAGATVEQVHQVCDEIRSFIVKLRNLDPDEIDPSGQHGTVRGIVQCESGLDLDKLARGFLRTGPPSVLLEQPDVMRELAGSTFDMDMLSKEIASGCKLVVTHGDLLPCNILVHNDHLSGIIDWEWAGIYPSCWERGVTDRNALFSGSLDRFVRAKQQPVPIRFIHHTHSMHTLQLVRKYSFPLIDWELRTKSGTLPSFTSYRIVGSVGAFMYEETSSFGIKDSNAPIEKTQSLGSTTSILKR